jgi:hypothetical protein
MLKRYPLPSRANKLLAMSKLRLRAAVGPLTGPTSLRTHLYKVEHKQNSKNACCGYDKEKSVHIVRHCLIVACKSYRTWGSMFQKSEDLEKVRVSSLLSLVTNTGLGLVSTSQTGEEIQRKKNDPVSLGSVQEPLA